MSRCLATWWPPPRVVVSATTVLCMPRSQTPADEQRTHISECVWGERTQVCCLMRLKDGLKRKGVGIVWSPSPNPRGVKFSELREQNADGKFQAMKQPLVLTANAKLMIMMYCRHEKQGLATVVQELLRAQNSVYKPSSEPRKMCWLNTSPWSAHPVELVAYTL
jgi:hypothetical protein